MNCGTAYSEKTVHGYVGRFRLDWRTEHFPVRAGGKDGPIEYFPSAAEAECAAWRVKDKVETKRMVRGGTRIGKETSEADIVFAKFTKQKGREKRIPVERRTARA